MVPTLTLLQSAWGDISAFAKQIFFVTVFQVRLRVVISTRTYYIVGACNLNTYWFPRFLFPHCPIGLISVTASKMSNAKVTGIKPTS